MSPREELGALARTQSLEGWVWAVCWGCPGIPVECCYQRQAPGPLGLLSKSRGLSPGCSRVTYSETYMTQPHSCVNPGGPSSGAPKAISCHPLFMGTHFGVVCPGHGSKAKEESPPSPALAAPAALCCLLQHLSQDELTVNSHNHTAAGPA